MRVCIASVITIRVKVLVSFVTAFVEVMNIILVMGGGQLILCRNITNADANEIKSFTYTDGTYYNKKPSRFQYNQYTEVITSSCA